MKNLYRAVVCVVVLAASGHVLADYNRCMDRVEREYQLCEARCERNVDLGDQSYNQSSWGAFNNMLQDQADSTFRQAVKEGRMTESQYENYRRSQKSIQQAGRGMAIGRCQSDCLDDKSRSEDYCG